MSVYEDSSKSARPTLSYGNSNVRLGNWYEDLCEAENQRNITAHLHLKSSLYTAIACRVYDNFLREIPTGLVKDQITFGQVVQLVAPRLVVNGMTGVVVSATIAVADVQKVQEITENARVVATEFKTPTARSLYQIVSCGEKTDDRLCFNAPFAIATAPGATRQTLYLEAEPPRVGAPTNAQNHSILRLSTKPTTYTKWKAVSLIPERRDADAGKPISLGELVVIKQVMTNRALGVATNVRLNTFFGEERSVISGEYMDDHMPEPDHIIWSLSLSHAGKNQK